MLEEHVLTDEDKKLVSATFLELYSSENYSGVLRFRDGLNRQAKAYVNGKYYYELINARTAAKRDGKK